MLKTMQPNRRRGFTLVELLIVVIIIAVLAAVAIPRFADSGKRSKTSATQANLKLMRNAIESFRNDVGANPATLTDLTKETGVQVGTGTALSPLQQKDWKGPYLREVPMDPLAEPVDVAGNGNWTYVKPNNGSTATVNSVPEPTF